jgi:ABC-type transporter Mla MlaB component
MKNFFGRKRQHNGDTAGDKRDMASATVTCGDVLDISVVTTKYNELKQMLNNAQTIEVSAAELQRIDGAGVQLLVALFREAADQGKVISWKDTSESLLEAASLLGVKNHLQLN